MCSVMSVVLKFVICCCLNSVFACIFYIILYIMLSDEDSYSDFGTALDPLDEDDIPRKKPFSLEDQIVRDINGKRRFHGAFTGGFSAGFFNTVGSLEGWVPSSFKSSRLERAEKKTQNPQDFMDDDDFSEFGIAPKVLRASSDFSEESRKRKREPTHFSSGPNVGEPVLRELLQAVRETVGIKLLRRMGWKPGQGIGPRLSRKEKHYLKQEDKKRSNREYNLVPDHLSCSDSSDEEYMKNLTFAPDDFQPFLYKSQSKYFGIGYSGLDKKSVLSGHINLFQPSSLILEEKKKGSISGQAFGVGILEDDDEDIYAVVDISQYDFSLETTSVHSDKKKQHVSFEFIKCSESVLDGFILSKSCILAKRCFPPPVLPDDFQPIHVVRVSRFEPEPSSVNNIKQRGLERHTHSVSDRKHILMQPEMQTREPNNEEKPSETLKIPENLTTLQTEANHFRPFVGFPEKQKRYEQFLTLVNKGQKEQLADLQPLHMTDWEKDRERIEFEQAAHFFCPLLGPMNDRFVPAVQSDDAIDHVTVVEKQSDDRSAENVAASLNMFGSFTRKKIPWQPCSQLCKRFNVAEPHIRPCVPSSISQKKSSQFNVFDYLNASCHNAPQSQHSITDTKRNPQAEVEEKIETELGLNNGESSDMRQTNVDMEFPDLPKKIDLFKAIFLSSSDESHSEKETVSVDLSEPNGANHPDSTKTQDMNPKILRNTSPPRGVFANLNLDALSICRPVQITSSVKTSVTLPETVPNESCTNFTSSTEEFPVYGPKLPSTLSVPVFKLSNKDKVGSISDVEWVEKSKKYSHKNKYKKFKKSSKHKKRKSKKTKEINFFTIVL